MKTNYLEIFLYLFYRLGLKSFKPFKNILRAKKNIKDYYKRILQNIPKEMLGNPIFVNDTDYTQNKATLFEYDFNKLNYKDAINYLDLYFELCVTLWKYGYHDNVYNFTSNSGLDKSNKIVMIDFNELDSDLESIKSDFKLKRWEHKYNYLCLENKQKEYFNQKVGLIFTVENLEKNWKINLIN